MRERVAMEGSSNQQMYYRAYNTSVEGACASFSTDTIKAPLFIRNQ